MAVLLKPLWEFIPEISTEIEGQLRSDQERWGDTWRKLSRTGQEARIYGDIQRYFQQFENAGVPVPWLKIIGLALIGWMREKHPEQLLLAPNPQS